jgi:hypothetical protein
MKPEGTEVVPPRYHGTILLLLCGINNPITIEALINDCPFHHSYKIDVSCIKFEQISWIPEFSDYI